MARSQRASRIAFGILAYGGIALLGLGALFLLRTLAITAFGERAEGTVIGNDWRNELDSEGRAIASVRAIVRFEAEGRTVEFTSAVGTSKPSHQVNDTVRVYYWPGHPDEATIGGFAEWFLRPMIVGGIGLVLLAIGGGFLWGPAWFVWRRRHIIAKGIPVRAKVLAIRLERSVEVDDRSPWVIVAEFKDENTGQTVPCTSHYLWVDPAPEYPVGSGVLVYHIPDQPHKYAFQLETTHGSP